MEIIKQDIDALNAVIKVQLKKEDYEPKVEQSLSTYRKRVDLKGFRKGHVPKQLLKKMYGNQVLAETVNDLLSSEVNKYIVENSLDILGHPIPKSGQSFNVEINDMKDFDFEYEIGLAPDFELDYLKKKPSLTREVPKVEDKMLDEEVERMRKRYGNVEEVLDKMEEEDMLQVKIEAMDDSGHHHHTSITLDMIKDEKVKKAIMKLKKDESIDLAPFEVFDREEAVIAKQVIGQEGLMAENAPSYKMTIESVKRVKPAEINAEFLNAVFGKDEVKDEAGLRAKIKEDIETYFERQADNKLYNKVAEELITKTKMDLPDEFLKRWIGMTNEKPITPEQIENDYESFARNLKWSLIVKKVGKENNIEVSQEELRAKIAEQVKQQMLQYGLAQISDEETEQFVNNMMSNQDHVNQTKETILEEKLFEYFKSQIAVKDKKVSLEDFNKQ